MRFIICALFFMISCNEEVNDTLCTSSQNEQTGFYTMVTQERSGDCGSMGTLQVDIERGVEVMRTRTKISKYSQQSSSGW